MGGRGRSLISRQGIAHRLALAASLAAGLTAAAQEDAGDAPGSPAANFARRRLNGSDARRGRPAAAGRD